VRDKPSRLLRLLAIFAVGVAAFAGSAFRLPVTAVNTGSLRFHAAGVVFEPISFTFASPRDGWVLGITPCDRPRLCLTLRETTNRGQSWRSRSLPRALVTEVNRNGGGTAFQRDFGLMIHFANKSDGWIFGELRGESIFWSTHDGGKTWRRLSTALMGPYGSIFDIESTAKTAYLIAQNKADRVSLESSQIGSDEWRVLRTPVLNLPAGGANPGGSIVLKGKTGWLVVGNDRGVSGSARLSADGRWVKWNPPCYSVGNSYVVPAAATLRELVVVCQMGGFASALSKTAPPGAKLQSNWIYVSYNAGYRFVHGVELRPILQLDDVLAAPAPRTILLSENLESNLNSTQQLLRSDDGGQRWTVVYRGWVYSLAFQSSTQGVAIVQQPNGANSMIMTCDGGSRWSVVTP
jgi:photosystem II stability/assembly factor-like uncharacterized protein